MSFSEGLKNEFQPAVVNEPSVLEPLKFYCIWSESQISTATVPHQFRTGPHVQHLGV